MLGHRLRRRLNINPLLDQRPVISGRVILDSTLLEGGVVNFIFQNK